MISLDQIQMLEHKVESAVAKIAALQELNSALRDKNTELEHTNSMLTQRISSFEADQGRIEQGILNALDRLNSMESAVLKSGTIAGTPLQQSSTPQNTESKPQIPVTQSTSVDSPAVEPEQAEDEQDPLLAQLGESSDEISLDFDTEDSETTPQNPQFDIF